MSHAVAIPSRWGYGADNPNGRRVAYIDTERAGKVKSRSQDDISPG